MPHVTNPDLEAAILADLDGLDDPRPFLVYGDWLTDHGDPRGELVAVQSELAGATTPELVDKEQKLLAEHKAAWLGDFADLGDDDFACTWRHGFVASWRLGPPTNKYKKSKLDFAASYAKLAALPGMAFVRDIVIGSKDADDWPASWRDVIEAMVEHGLPPALRSLDFDRGGYWDISSTELGDVSVLYPRLRSLRALRIEMGQLELGKINLPELRSFEVVTGGLTVDNVESIENAAWPQLERLTIYTGATDNDYGCQVTIHHLEPIFAAQGLGRLRHLGIANTSFADDLPRVLAASRILPQLTSIDLSHGTFGDDGARALIEHAAAFRHLEHIDLSRSYVTPALAAHLQRLGPKIILDEQQDPGENGEDRYVSVSE